MMRRGDVFWATLRLRSGSEQTGRRPVIIVSHDGFNQTPVWRSVIVVPLSTSPTQRGRGPTAVPIAKGTAGLSRAGVALCHQVTTIDRGKLDRRIGSLPSNVLGDLETGLRIAIDLR